MSRARGGVFAVSRGLFRHPLFKRSKADVYPPGYAWIWMVGQAGWREHTIRQGDNGPVLTLRRGEFAHTYEHMATEFGWHRSRVQRFIETLKSDLMIDTRTDKGRLIISICNYDKFQIVALPADISDDRAAILARSQEEDLKEEDPKEEEGAEPPAAPNAGKDYAFEGLSLKLTPRDYDKWRRDFPNVPDFDAELRLADVYYAERPPKDGKSYLPIYRWMDRVNKDPRRGTRPAAPFGISVGGGFIVGLAGG